MCGINGFSWDGENLIKDMNRVFKNRVLDNHESHTGKNILLCKDYQSLIHPINSISH